MFRDKNINFLVLDLVLIVEFDTFGNLKLKGETSLKKRNNFQNDLFSIQIYQLLIRLTFLLKSIERINIEGEMVSTLLLLEY